MDRALYGWDWGPVPALVARISLRRSILGVYLDPPESAVVLCVDKRVRFGHWNARIRCCRWDFGYIEGVMRDHRRHGHHGAVCRAGHGQRHGDKPILSILLVFPFRCI